MCQSQSPNSFPPSFPLDILISMHLFSISVPLFLLCKRDRLYQFYRFHIHAFSSVKSLSHVQIFANPWTAAHQASLSITNSRSFLKFMSIESVMPSSHLILLIPFSSCPQSLPASGSFPMSQPFTWGGQSTGVSASTSVLPMNTQDWSPLGWTGWILLSKGCSRVLQHHRPKASSLLCRPFFIVNSHIHTWPLEKP